MTDVTRHIYLAFREEPKTGRTFLGAFTEKHEAENYLIALAPALDNLKLYRVRNGGSWQTGESPAEMVSEPLPLKITNPNWRQSTNQGARAENEGGVTR